MMTKNANPLILVTGATGFLGTAIVQQLRSQTCRLRTTARRRLPQADLPDYRHVDLSDSDAVSSIMEGVNVVVHAAGLAHQRHARSTFKDEFFRINSGCTETVTRAAVAAGCRRMILVSSVSVYGGGQSPKSESHPCRPVSDYARSKLDSERLAAGIAASTGLELAILRMATIYGEGDPGNVGRLMQAIDRRRFIWVGKGLNHKSLIHVEDAARACTTAALRDELPCGGVFNVSSPHCTMLDIVSLFAEALGRHTPALKLPSPVMVKLAACANLFPGCGRFASRAQELLEKLASEEVFDGSLFRDKFDWNPRVSLAEGVARQVSWHRHLTPESKRRPRRRENCT